MKITCTKLFKTYEEAKAFTLAHLDGYAKLSRASEKIKSQLESESDWMVKWYEFPG